MASPSAKRTLRERLTAARSRAAQLLSREFPADARLELDRARKRSRMSIRNRQSTGGNYVVTENLQ